jgi:hypothetical protein
MTDFTANVQLPGLAGLAPTYNTCTATDKFTAAPNSRYMLHYKNGATAQVTGGSNNTVTDPTTPIPGASGLSAGFANAITKATPGYVASEERVVWIDNTNRFRDSTGAINLVHPGTLTTVTVAIFGPF